MTGETRRDCARLALVQLGLTLALQLSAASALAQAAPANAGAFNSPEYKELVRQALEQYTLGHWSESRVLFLKAHELAPNARTLRGLALVCYESRHYVEAIDYAGQAIDSPVQPLAAQMKAEMQQLADQARGFVGRAQIISVPADAEVRVDGKLVQRAPDGIVLLDPGPHKLVAVAPGYEINSWEQNIDGGADVRFDIVLSKISSGETIASAAPGATAPTGSSGAGLSAIAPWIVVGASAALAITGGVLLALGESDRATVNDAKAPSTWSDVKDSYERAPTLLALGGVLLGVGIAGVATGLTWKFWLQPQSERAPSASLRVTPAGAQLSGTF